MRMVYTFERKFHQKKISPILILIPVGEIFSSFANDYIPSLYSSLLDMT